VNEALIFVLFYKITMKVAVGSGNPVKLKAVEEVFRNFFGDVKVIGVRVESGVSSQPVNEEVIKGAIQRAKLAIKKCEADFGVGIESGIIRFGEKFYNLNFIAIIDRSGNLFTGISGGFELQDEIVEELNKGKELSDIVEEITGLSNIRHNKGLIGILTDGKIDRKELIKQGVFMALASMRKLCK